MYIPEFWCGVGLTLILEVIALVIWIIISMKGKDDEDNNN